MRRMQGSYALVQYSPVSERMEFFNLGVILVVPELEYLGVRFAESHARIDRYLRSPNDDYLRRLKAGTAARLRFEFDRGLGIRGLEDFARKRANDIRISAFLPMAVVEPEASLQQLFVDLVGEEPVSRHLPRMATRLKEAFRSAGVGQLLDEHPQAVELPEAGIKVHAPFGYQNGAYNLVDAVRFAAKQDEAMKAAGKRALEGGLLWKHSASSGDQKRLVLVADFGDHPLEFSNAVGEQLEQNDVTLYRIGELEPLFDDIRLNANLHAR
jgi:hypothetical protein